MELISSQLRLNYMKYRWHWTVFSVLLTVFAIYTWIDGGTEKYGVDFAGGTDVIVRFEQETDINEVRSALDEAGLQNASLQVFAGSSEYSIRLKADTEAGSADRVTEALEKIEGKTFTILKEDFVGPVIGEQIRENGLKAMLFAVLCLLIYISVRFEWRFALGAIIALFHDVIAAAGIYVWSGREVDAATLAALLTVLGYSLNDTIIIYDRVRENMDLARRADKKRKGVDPELGRMSFLELVNLSVNQTMSRTILTGVTTLFVVVTLWLLGGGEISDMAFVLLLGIIIGTYSTIFVACAVVIGLEGRRYQKEIEMRRAA